MHVRAFRRSSQGENEEWYVHFVQALLRPVRKSYCRHGLHLFVFGFCILSARQRMIACYSVLSSAILLFPNLYLLARTLICPCHLSMVAFTIESVFGFSFEILQTKICTFQSNKSKSNSLVM